MSTIPAPWSGPTPQSPPSGTVTFAFTDIEGSTRRWEERPAAMQAAVRRHDALLRTIIGAHGGHVFKTIGDAFCATFSDPPAAAAAMIAVQEALAAEDFSSVDGLRVRAALHAGSADERDGDYFGPAVNRVARLLAVAHGGQIVVSGAARALIAPLLASTIRLRDLGEHRLKDLARPEHVYQLVAPGLPGDFPALRSLDVLAHNLPLELTNFVGREDEVAAIAALVREHRLVTLVGSGGVGKTRTSLHAAASLLDEFGDGVWFIELAPLGSGDYIASTIAQTLEMRLAAQGDPLSNLVSALRAKKALLVFDNCEHMVAAAARAAAALVQGCPDIRILASSRQRLEIAGEQVLRLPSLDAAAAVALFVERARANDYRFTLTDETTPIVADICRRLDGIPLAIELAASRVKILSPRQLRDRLDERFRVLTGGSRDALPRQQTLRALIDWSHDLLDARERALFRRLGIFVKGFSLESAAAVTAGDGLDEFDVFDVLASLVDKSLVLAEPDGADMRYRLLESTRAYALEKLGAAGEREQLAGRHRDHLCDRFAKLRSAAAQTSRVDELIATLSAELEEVRAALDTALESAHITGGADLLAAIGKIWSNLALDREAIDRHTCYLARLTMDAAGLRARLATTLSFLHAVGGRKRAGLEIAIEAVACARASGDETALAWALEQFAWNATLLDRDDEARTALAQAEALPQSTPQLRLRLREKRALLAQTRGDFTTAARTYEVLRGEYRALGDTRGELVMAICQAETEHARGQTARALAIAGEILPSLRAIAERSLFGLTLQNVAGYFCAVDDIAAALDAAHQAAALHANEPGHAHVAVSLEHAALAIALSGDLGIAAQLGGYVAAAHERNGYHREYTESTTYDRLQQTLRAGLDPSDFAGLTEFGAALAPESALALLAVFRRDHGDFPPA